MDVDDTMDVPHGTEFPIPTQSNRTAAEERRTAFQQCIDDYENTADSNPDELGRALTYVVGELLSVTGSVGNTLTEFFQRGPAKIEDVKEVEKPLDCFLKLTRQIDRYTNLELRIEEVRLKAKSTNDSVHHGRHLGISHYGNRPPDRYTT
jgi:hypothetical protein